MAKTQKVKISLQASLKEYEFEVEDKKKFTAEIEASSKIMVSIGIPTRMGK